MWIGISLSRGVLGLLSDPRPPSAQYCSLSSSSETSWMPINIFGSLLLLSILDSSQVTCEVSLWEDERPFIPLTTYLRTITLRFIYYKLIQLYLPYLESTLLHVNYDEFYIILQAFTCATTQLRYAILQRSTLTLTIRSTPHYLRTYWANLIYKSHESKLIFNYLD